MDVLKLIHDALSGLNVPVGAGTLLADPLPELFLIWSMTSDPELFADDEEKLRSYLVNVSIFSRRGLHDLPDVDGVMKAAGFVKGAERMEPYSMNDGYFHLIKDFTYLDQAQ